MVDTDTNVDSSYMDLVVEFDATDGMPAALDAADSREIVHIEDPNMDFGTEVDTVDKCYTFHQYDLDMQEMVDD